MSSTAGWHEYAFGRVLTFRSPVRLARTNERGIDSNVGVWEGEGVRVLVDHGLFSDPLTHHADRAGHTVLEESVAGVRARVASYPRAEGGQAAAVHFAHLGGGAGRRRVRLTMTVEADALDGETLLEVVRSIRFTEPNAASSDST
jgi:hypothetical protein